MGLFSSLFGSGNKSAYDTSGVAAATQQSNDLYKKTYEDTVAAGQPWMDLGKTGAADLTSQLTSLTTPFSASTFMTDPGYQFTQDQGIQAIQRANAAKGSVYAPSTDKALAQYTTGLANQTFNDAFSRDQQSKSSIYDMLMGASNVGQTQVGINGQLGANYADNVSNNNIGLQNAILGAAQSKNSATQSMLGNWINLGGRAAAAYAGKA